MVLKFAKAAFVVAITEACQTSVSARVIFKWLHLPLTSRLPAVIQPHDWLTNLAMDLAVLCDGYVELNIASMDTI